MDTGGISQPLFLPEYLYHPDTPCFLAFRKICFYPMSTLSSSAKLRPETIITSHSNADFDALASMVATGKLYPDAVLVTPSIQERTAPHSFTDSLMHLFSFHQARDIDFSGVKTLVVVDTRQRSRIPHVAQVLDMPNLTIHLYDHHPNTADDLQGDVSVLKPWGSATAIITQMLREKQVALSPDEATMLGLGIYEDTGSFTFSSTTEEDLTAAAWLLGKGMNVNIIGELITRDLSRDQLHVLNTLLESANTHTIKGISIVIAEASLEVFLGDFAVLAHKMMDMENLKVLFAIARMGDRVQIVARSRHPEVDVSKICAAFGGGGHSYASSASLKDKTLAEVKAELLALLMVSVNPHIMVRDHMTSPAITAEETHTIVVAEDIMTRYGLKAVPVVKSGSMQCVGYLEQQTAARAVAHGLGDLPVGEYMQRNVLTVDPESTLFPAMDIILTQRQRLVPVVSCGNVVGVLTRTDVIRLLVEDSALRIPEGDPLSAPLREKNIRSTLMDRLPEEHVKLLTLAGELGDELGHSVFAVGGFVRDLLMNRPNLDIDLSIEGDGIAFAKSLAERLGGRVRPHLKFKTAVVAFTGSDNAPMHIDVATARLEYYEHPGALPTVELSSIKMDLFRRDFTINALAVQLNAKRFGMLVDPFGAQRDMKEKTLNILHSLSFIEDPTRILRAMRFMTRFQFRLGQQTERLIKNALQLKMLDRISPSRLFNEFQHILEERDVAECLQRMDSLELLGAIHPLLKLTPNKSEMLAEMESVLSWHRRLYTNYEPRIWIPYLAILCLGGKHPVVNEVLDRFEIFPRPRREFMRLRETLRYVQRQLPKWEAGDQSMSELYAMLSPLPVEGILLLMALEHGKSITKHISHFLTRLYCEKLDITGDDLREIGVSAGPLFKEILDKVLAAKLDGKTLLREEQLVLAKDLFLESLGDGAMAYKIADVLNGRT